MIKLEWICADCDTVQTYENLNNDPLKTSEMIRIKCKKCKNIFELIMRLG